MILHRLYGNVPALNRMALRAIRAHLSLVYVGVAILAVPSNVGEDRFHVALRALHFLVHAAQWILRLIVVKFRNRFDRSPSRCGVTVLARDREPPVRTAAILRLRFGRGSIGVSWLPDKEQKPAQNLKKRARNCPLYI